MTGLPSMAHHQPIDSPRMESKVTEIAGMLENKFKELLSKRIIEQTQESNKSYVDSGNLSKTLTR